jgi:superfamily II DNA or RNA helicase
LNEIIELFDSLDKSKSSISELRKAQTESFNLYETHLDSARIGIKLPTGSGKSLIAILILEYWRRKGKVVALLASNKALANDIKLKCDEIGIPSALVFGAESGDSKYRIERFRNLTRYKAHQIIGVQLQLLSLWD